MHASGQPINIRRPYHRVARTSHRVIAHLVGIDDQDIRLTHLRSSCDRAPKDRQRRAAAIVRPMGVLKNVSTDPSAMVSDWRSEFSGLALATKPIERGDGIAQFADHIAKMPAPSRTLTLKMSLRLADAHKAE